MLRNTGQYRVTDIVIGQATMSAFSSMRTEALQLKARLEIRPSTRGYIK